MALEYFYDAQLRALIQQCVRVFSGFQVEYGRDLDGIKRRITVPCTMAEHDRMVSNIVRSNSENTILAVPQITVWISEMKMAPQRRQSPNFIGHYRTQERHFDQTEYNYTGSPGIMYTVDRFMPVPVDITLKVEIWAANLNQKFELLEQILVLFNPAIDIQANVNAADWTSLKVLELVDINYSSRTLPVGTGNEIDVATLTYNIPFWINPAAKVEKSVLIHEIITSLSDSIFVKIDETYPYRTIAPTIYGETAPYARVVTTFDDYQISVDGNIITLLSQAGSKTDAEGNLLNWTALFKKYGQLKVGISQLNLKTDSNFESETTDIIGLIQFTKSVNELYWSPNITTLPINNLDPINLIIDPSRVFPGTGLLPAIHGQRYLLLGDTSVTSIAWGSVTAFTNDIIEYSSSAMAWQVVFSAANTTTMQYLVNAYTGVQLAFVPNDGWRVAVGGIYSSGFWSVTL